LISFSTSQARDDIPAKHLSRNSTPTSQSPHPLYCSEEFSVCSAIMTSSQYRVVKKCTKA
jgi:hypothetical protein